MADGNGRMARLLTTHELLAQGYGVARYVSMEQLIFASKNGYYGSLYESQRAWHEGEHSIWPWVTYLVGIVADAYSTFEERLAAATETGGNEQEQVRRYILERAPTEFSRRQVERTLPGLSTATIRLVLSELRDEGRIEAIGAGRGSRWRRL